LRSANHINFYGHQILRNVIYKQGTVVAKKESKKFRNLYNNCAEKTFLNRSQIIHVCFDELIRNNFIIDYIIEKILIKFIFAVDGFKKILREFIFAVGR